MTVVLGNSELVKVDCDEGIKSARLFNGKDDNCLEGLNDGRVLGIKLFSIEGELLTTRDGGLDGEDISAVIEVGRRVGEIDREIID